MRRLACLLALAFVLPLASCKKKPPSAPPEFEDPQRAMTGDAALEGRISEAVRLEEIGDEELARLREEGVQVGRGAALSAYIAAMTGRGNVQESIDTLMERAWYDLGDEVKVADLLELTMGQLKWSACAQITTEIVERRMAPEIFLLRALCLRRSGDAVNAMENLEAAIAREALDPDVVQVIRELLDERAGGNQLPPADEARYRILRDALGPKGPLYRLFVKHLTERTEPGWTTGTLDWFGVTGDEQRSVVLSRARSYRHCHSLAQYASKEKLSGFSTVVFFIDGLGRVLNPAVQESEWGEHAQEEWLNSCFVDQIKKLRFPLPAYGRSMPARHRFSYTGD